MKTDTAAHYTTLPAPNRTYILLQTTSLEADTLAHIPSLNTGFHGAARASSAQPGLWFSAPVTTHGLLGSSSNKGGVAVLVSVISSAFWDHSPSLAPEAQPIT